jgi:hypothetical protein
MPNMSIVAGCFSLDYLNYRILEYFTKYGQASRKVVGDHNFKYSPNLHEKQTGRRIESLVELGYLQQVGTRNIRNLKNKVEILYDLTFKGFVASLLYTKLEDTVYFKKYLEFIDEIDKHQSELSELKLKPLRPFVITFVKKQLEYFLSIIALRGIKLDSVNDIPTFIDIMIKNIHGFSKSQTKDLQKFDSSISKCYNKIDFNNYSKYHKELFLWVYYWQYTLDLISQSLTANKVISKLKKDYPSEYMITIRREREARLEKELKEKRKSLRGRL